MSIASEISRIQSAKTDIRTAIENKGVTVPSSATIDTYDDYVSQIYIYYVIVFIDAGFVIFHAGGI